MAEGAVNGSGASVEGERAFSLQKLYIKDFSFEAPNSPAFFFERRTSQKRQKKEGGGRELFCARMLMHKKRLCQMKGIISGGELVR